MKIDWILEFEIHVMDLFEAYECKTAKDYEPLY